MLQELMGRASITTTLDPCPGEMDRYPGRLNEAAGIRPLRPEPKYRARLPGPYHA